MKAAAAEGCRLLRGLQRRVVAFLTADVRVADPADVLAGVAGLAGDVCLTDASVDNSLADDVEQLTPSVFECRFGATVRAQGAGQLLVRHVVSVADPDVAYQGWRLRGPCHAT